jgi:F-type H+-transporting ATPase subunit a
MTNVAALSFLNWGSGIMEEGEEAGHQGSEYILEELSNPVIITLPKVFGIDFSITKAVIVMWIVSVLITAIFVLAFRKRRLVPHGLANFLEMIIVFLQEDVFKPYLGEHARRFTPFLLTMFFFILVNNLMGLVPPNFKATANISVTSALALITFSVVIGSGIKQHGLKGYAAQYFPKGVPWFVLVVLVPAEILGMFTKHLALAIRLFANMFAGDVVLFAMISFIFIFKSFAVAPLSVAGALAVDVLEILIDVIQAYIFTILSAVFIGMSIEHE